MERKSRFARQYDPSNPRRAKNLDDLDWDPLKATITSYHEGGYTRAQIIQLLGNKHDFFASPAQLNKQMGRWDLRVKKREKPSTLNSAVCASNTAGQHSPDRPHSIREESSLDQPSSILEQSPLDRPASIPEESSMTGKLTLSALEPFGSAFSTSSQRGFTTKQFSAASQPASTLLGMNTRKLSNTSSRSSSAPDNASSIWSASRGGSTPGRYSSSATDPSLEDGNDPTDQVRFHRNMDILRKYQPGHSALNIWRVSELSFRANVECSCGDAEPRLRCDIWKFWDKLGNTADALAASAYPKDAFDLHYTSFLKMFTRTGPLLLHYKSVAQMEDDQITRDGKIASAIASRASVLRLMIRAAIGAIRTCTDAAHSELASLMLDSALCIASQMEFPTGLQSLAFLFRAYVDDMPEQWQRRCRSVLRGSSLFSANIPGQLQSAQHVSVVDLLKLIHPSIFNREHLFLYAHMTFLLHKQKPCTGFAEVTTPESRKSLVAFISRNLLSLDRDPGLDTEAYACRFIENYLDEAGTFLEWCTSAVAEGEAHFVRSFRARSDTSSGVSLSTEHSRVHARLTLYWFLVWRATSLECKSKTHVQFNADWVAKFYGGDHSSTFFDALYVLAELIFQSYTPDPWTESFSTTWQDIPSYALAQLKAVTPKAFAESYLRHTIRSAMRIGRWSPSSSSATIERQYIDSVILADPYVSQVTSSEPDPEPDPELLEDAMDVLSLDQSVSSQQQRKSHSSSAHDAASSASRRDTRSSYMTSSSSMSEDTRAFRRDARRLNGRKDLKSKDRRMSEMSSSSCVSSHSWDFEHVSGMPSQPPDPDIQMEEPLPRDWGLPRYYVTPTGQVYYQPLPNYERLHWPRDYRDPPFDIQNHTVEHCLHVDTET